MKPKHAAETLTYIMNNQKTVTVAKIEEMVKVIVDHNKNLTSANKNQRKRINAQSELINKYRAKERKRA